MQMMGKEDHNKPLQEGEMKMKAQTMSKVGLTVLVSGLMLLCSTVSFAQPSASDDGATSRFIQRFDKDGDGSVSKEEFPGRPERFSRLDANGDGMIDSTEAPQGRRHHGKGKRNLIEKFDKNGDGVVSKDEFPGREECFADMDTNGDGSLDSSEAANKRCPKWDKGGNFIQNLDKDNDGKVSKEEFPGPEARFAQLDANADGYIDSSEAPKGPPHRGKRGRAPLSDSSNTSNQ